MGCNAAPRDTGKHARLRRQNYLAVTTAEAGSLAAKTAPKVSVLSNPYQKPVLMFAEQARPGVAKTPGVIVKFRRPNEPVRIVVGPADKLAKVEYGINA
jgi:hypothetical protein